MYCFLTDLITITIIFTHIEIFRQKQDCWQFLIIENSITEYNSNESFYLYKLQTYDAST